MNVKTHFLIKQIDCNYYWNNKEKDFKAYHLATRYEELKDAERDIPFAVEKQHCSIVPVYSKF